MVSEETRAAPNEARQLRLRSATLLFREDGKERAFTVRERSLLGSSPDATIRLNDPMVSRVHLELDPRADGVWVRDLGSKNGTYLNDVKIVEARAPARAQLRVGSTEIALRADERSDVALWPEGRFVRLLGESLTMRALFAMLDRLRASDAAVLIHGETGTGKELVADAIHNTSKRAEHPFVTVDCAALPANLLESELFGHARGAFTGAVAAREGAFEAANGGTIFLDEIGELPLSMQPKLLRVLENKTVRRLGETAHRPLDVRVVAATHRDLLSMVSRGEFREDLYFRLGVVLLSVPPLRDRREDIPLLIEHFAGGVLTAELTASLAARSFRGNVRELRNLVERVRALGPGALDSLDASEVSPVGEPDLEQDYRAYRDAWIEEGERRYAVALLERHGGNVSAAARSAGITRNYLHRILRRTR